MSEYWPIDEALGRKIGEFLCWPQYDEETALQRIQQLKTLGVEAVATGGPHEILSTPILGKGHAGVVIRAMFEGREVALKARRTDTSRLGMGREAGFLAHVNRWGVGPRLFGVSEDFLVMELLVGPYYGEWVEAHLFDRGAVIDSVRAVLDTAWRLDQSGLDHGELTRIKRHFIVTVDGPRVIDFESASLDRTPSNLTCTVQSLFMNHRFAEVLRKVYPMPDRGELLVALKRYKRDPVESNYRLVLEACNL
ncbi:MAG: serine/threonine protein kinase [Candidatus Bathyarchaeota archaeon]